MSASMLNAVEYQAAGRFTLQRVLALAYHSAPSLLIDLKSNRIVRTAITEFSVVADRADFFDAAVLGRLGRRGGIMGIHIRGLVLVFASGCILLGNNFGLLFKLHDVHVYTHQFCSNDVIGRACQDGSAGVFLRTNSTQPRLVPLTSPPGLITWLSFNFVLAFHSCCECCAGLCSPEAL